MEFLSLPFSLSQTTQDKSIEGYFFFCFSLSWLGKKNNLIVKTLALCRHLTITQQ